MKILVVEDEDSLRETIIRSLEKERYTALYRRIGRHV